MRHTATGDGATAASAAGADPCEHRSGAARRANGAQIVRVHDVAATRDALAVWQAVKTIN